MHPHPRIKTLFLGWFFLRIESSLSGGLSPKIELIDIFFTDIFFCLNYNLLLKVYTHQLVQGAHFKGVHRHTYKARGVLRSPSPGRAGGGGGGGGNKLIWDEWRDIWLGLTFTPTLHEIFLDHQKLDSSDKTAILSIYTCVVICFYQEFLLYSSSWQVSNNNALTVLAKPEILCTYMCKDTSHRRYRTEGVCGVNQAYSRLSTTHGHITDC